MTSTRVRTSIVALALAAAGGFSSTASAAVVFNSAYSSVDVAHDRSRNQGAPDQPIHTAKPAVLERSALTLNYQHDFLPVTSDLVKSKARAGVAHLETDTVAKAVIAAGTGVDQQDPDHNANASELVVNFELFWENRGFGPPISSSFNIPVGGTVGDGGSASFSIVLNWLGGRGSPDSSTSFTTEALRPQFATSRSWVGGTDGLVFSETISATAQPMNVTFLNPDIYQWFILKGTLTFRANNDLEPVFLGLSQDAELGIDQAAPNANLIPLPSAAMGGALLLTGALARRRRPLA